MDASQKDAARDARDSSALIPIVTLGRLGEAEAARTGVPGGDASGVPNEALAAFVTLGDAASGGQPLSLPRT